MAGNWCRRRRSAGRRRNGASIHPLPTSAGAPGNAAARQTCELNMMSAISQPHRILSSIAFFDEAVLPLCEGGMPAALVLDLADHDFLASHGNVWTLPTRGCSENAWSESGSDCSHPVARAVQFPVKSVNQRCCRVHPCESSSCGVASRRFTRLLTSAALIYLGAAIFPAAPPN